MYNHGAQLKETVPMSDDTETVPAKEIHDSDCATHNRPALAKLPCDCSLSGKPRVAEPEQEAAKNTQPLP